MKNKDVLADQINRIGERIATLFFLSIPLLIWFYEYALAWKVSATLLFLVIFCAIIVVKLEETDE